MARQVEGACSNVFSAKRKYQLPQNTAQAGEAEMGKKPRVRDRQTHRNEARDS
jgi:hypothetical protein